ncbi:MAG: L,D-transpeptidase family protein [Pseudomonadota bacterium]
MITRFQAHADGRFEGPDIRTRCILGRSGVIAADAKSEGDGYSPAGTWRLLWVYYRPDRAAQPETGLPLTALKESDGWCDDPDHTLYNQLINRPFDASHEHLWRDDGVYDLIVVLSHNREPIIPGRGSAIFMHLNRPERTPTEGCVALDREDLLHVLKTSVPGTTVEIIS